MFNNKYIKTPFSLPEQIDKLESKGMLFDNRQKAEGFLYNVSYYRLRAYTYPFQDNSEEGEHMFIRDDISFDDIINLYSFDRELRTLIFKAIAIIEVSIRGRLTQIYSEDTGNSHWYTDCSLYKSNFDNIIDDIETEIARSNEEFIKHYYRKYTEPSLPPCWMALEVVSLGTLSRLYKNLNKDENKKRLAREYGVADVEVFANWLHAISNLRNCCAHHSRIWNRRFMVNLILPYNTTRPFMNRNSISYIKRNKLFSLLSCIKFLLDSIDNKNHFKEELFAILQSNCRLLSLKDMGFPNNWKELPIWK